MLKRIGEPYLSRRRNGRRGPWRAPRPWTWDILSPRTLLERTGAKVSFTNRIFPRITVARGSDRLGPATAFEAKRMNRLKKKTPLKPPQYSSDLSRRGLWQRRWRSPYAGSTAAIGMIRNRERRRPN
jgi:hypothetical protein